MNIDNIIFDLGVVIINIDNQGAISNLSSLGIKNANALFSRDNYYCIDYEVGKINDQVFINTILEHALTEFQINTDKIEKIWRSIIVDIPEWKIDMLKKLKEKYRIFALSNTNSIHVDEINKLYDRVNHSSCFFDLFDKAYLSHEIKIIKPDPKIFQFIINDSNIEPAQSIFIDDLAENLTAAKEHNFQTALVENDQAFCEVIEKLI